MSSSRHFLSPLVLVFALAWPGPGVTADKAKDPGQTFTNPLLLSGPDPWVAHDGADYYYMHTMVDRLVIWKTRDLSRLADAEQKTIWMPPAKGPNSKSIWAPELHRIDGKWYVYYTAVDGDHDDDLHRAVFALENSSPDPLKGEWQDRGRINTRFPALDGSTFVLGGTRYFVYSAYDGPDSVLAISRMKDPVTLAGDDVVIARPDLAWERQGGRQILEGPEFLAGPRGDLFIVYSASACWTDDYSLGILRAAPGSDPLTASLWKKSPIPVLKSAPGNDVYAPGHNGFFTSPDGKEQWIIYHANPGPGMGCTQKRSPRMQRFQFGADGAPVFGEPVSPSQRLSKPAS